MNKRKILALPYNIVMLMFFIAFYIFVLFLLYCKTKFFSLIIWLFLLLLVIIKKILDKKFTNNKFEQYYLNLIVTGYKLALVLFVIYLGMISFKIDANYNAYLICLIPCLLYIFDSSGINDIIKIFKYDLFE